jgi:hypothetical protein
LSRSSALTARARRYLADAAHAFDHAPVEVTLSVLLAITFSYAVASDAEPLREWFEIAVVMLLTGAIAFTATLLHALGAWHARTRWLVTAAGAVAAALYGMFVLDLELAAEAWRAAGLVAGAALLVLSAPALAGLGRATRAGSATERFRRVTGRLVLRTIAVLLYAAALYAGLALAVGAVNTLFELDLDARIYIHTLGWVFFVLVTWVVVGGLPDYVRPGGDAGPVAAAVHRVSAFLVTPLLAIYYLILYAYAIRIAVTGELPKNLVSPLVLAAGLIAGIALVLFDRAGTDPDRPDDAAADGAPGARSAAGRVTGDGAVTAVDDVDGMTTPAPRGAASFRSLRSAALLFVPLCGLGVWAVGMRVAQYGWTEFRGLRMMLLVTLGVLALGAIVRVVRRATMPVHVLPLTLAVVTVLSVVGPWNLLALSRRSQQTRLADAMGRAGIEWNATAVNDTIIPNEPHREITETARYLRSHFGARALPALFARHAEVSERYEDVVYAAGLRTARPDLAAPGGAYSQLDNGAVLEETEDATLYHVRLNLHGMRPRPGSPRSAAADSAARRAVSDTSAGSLALRIPVGGLTLFADLAPLSRQLLSDPSSSRGLSPDLARIPLTDASGRRRGDLFVLEIGIGGGEVHQLVGVARIMRP